MLCTRETRASSTLTIRGTFRKGTFSIYTKVPGNFPAAAAAAARTRLPELWRVLRRKRRDKSGEYYLPSVVYLTTLLLLSRQPLSPILHAGEERGGGGAAVVFLSSTRIEARRGEGGGSGGRWESYEYLMNAYKPPPRYYTVSPCPG